MNNNDNSRPNVLVIDASNMFMRCLHAIKHNLLDTNFVMYKTLFLTTLKNTIVQFNPDKVIICKEGFNNWRKEYYDLYKATRAVKRAESIIDFDKFFEINDAFITDLAAICGNFNFLQVPRCEADDLIACITKHLQTDNITVVSSDRDFYQLFKYDNYKQWHPIKHEYIQVANPESYLTEKIIIGDAGDNVPRLTRFKKGSRS